MADKELTCKHLFGVWVDVMPDGLQTRMCLLCGWPEYQKKGMVCSNLGCESRIHRWEESSNGLQTCSVCRISRFVPRKMTPEEAWKEFWNGGR